MRTLAPVALAAFACVAPCAANPALDALVAAYPDHLAGYESNDLIFRDGTRLPIDDGVKGKSFEQLLDAPDIKDQFAIPYPLGTANLRQPAFNEDPGRIRNQAMFVKMYGDCRKGEVKAQMKAVPWLPSRGGGTVMVTTANGVADQLAKVSRDLEQLPKEMTQYMVPSSGTFNCRVIAGTKRLSVHAYGAAIDLNAKFGDYWQWSKPKGGTLAWKNRIPLEIVEVFERHGFIWGGKWYHYDSFHFEYRPELIALARQGWPK
ncbi:M15 family metallopeptidase [Pseudorhodoplanes sp.]|uniref:M15 family metallopeptidase n=1 Tax=Pseudorhodoplanes sp. TaxID=1934341 RepID=UPI00391C43BE